MIQYGGAIELDSEDQHKPAEIQLHTDDFADQQQSSTPPQEILDSSSSSNAPAPTVDTVIPDQSSHYNKKLGEPIRLSWGKCTMASWAIDASGSHGQLTTVF